MSTEKYKKNSKHLFLSLGHSNFGFVSDFDIRISCFRASKMINLQLGINLFQLPHLAGEVFYCRLHRGRAAHVDAGGGKFV